MEENNQCMIPLQIKPIQFMLDHLKIDHLSLGFSSYMLPELWLIHLGIVTISPKCYL